MSFADHAILWLHVTAAVFTIGPGTAAIMSTPRFIRKRNPSSSVTCSELHGFIPSEPCSTLVFGIILAGMTHKFSQWWISVSLTLFVVAFVLLLLIMRDQRKALSALDHAAGAAVADDVDAVADVASGRAGSEAATAASRPAEAASSPPRGRLSPAGATTAPGPAAAAAVERGRIAPSAG